MLPSARIAYVDARRSCCKPTSATATSHVTLYRPTAEAKLCLHRNFCLATGSLVELIQPYYLGLMSALSIANKDRCQ